MSDFNNTNTRREDIIKAAKYHYGGGTHAIVVERMRCVVAFHNGIIPSAVSDSDLLAVVTNDTIHDTFHNPQDINRFFSDSIANYRQNELLAHLNSENVASNANDGIKLMLETYLNRVTWIDPKNFGGNLPSNCAYVEHFLDEHMKS